MLKNDIIVKKDEYSNVSTYDLTNLLNENKFDGSLESYARILLIETHAYRNFPVSIDELNETNVKIVEWLKTNNHLKYEWFEACLLKAKIMQKVNIPKEIINAKAKLIIEYDNLLKNIGYKNDKLNVI